MMNMSWVVLLTSVSFLFACDNSSKSTDPTANTTDTSAVVADTVIPDAADDTASVDTDEEDAAVPSPTDVSTPPEDATQVADSAPTIQNVGVPGGTSLWFGGFSLVE